MHGSFPNSSAAAAPAIFGFRPWVRKAGLSIVAVAALVTAVMVAALVAWKGARYGWVGEPFAWIYAATLWAGGAKVYFGTWRPIAEISAEALIVRPLHQLRATRIIWSSLRGTEQMVGGDRMILYFETSRGPRFVALNLNLVRGRKAFVELIESRMRGMGFSERVEGRSRYLTK